MPNERVEIHDPLANHNGVSAHDLKPASDSRSMEDSAEFRVMMAYARRRRRKTGDRSPAPDSPEVVSNGTAVNATTPSQTLVKTETEETEEKKKKKQKKKKKRLNLRTIFRCVNPRTDDDEEPERTHDEPNNVNNRCLSPSAGSVRESGGEEEEEEEHQLEEVASRLTELADEIPFIPPDLETDSEENEVEKMIGLLLRDSGDRLDQRMKDANISMEIFQDYGFFRMLMNTFLSRIGLRSPDPDAPGPQASPKTQIAVACEVTSRLSAINTLPMSRLLNHGARYLQDYYSSWVQQQGGYEAAFEDDDEEVE